MKNTYYIYILTNSSGMFYTGVTNNLERRMVEHKLGFLEGFSKKYHLHKLIFYEATGNITEAIAREKQIKNWSRVKKIRLIEQLNPHFVDLFNDFEIPPTERTWAMEVLSEPVFTCYPEPPSSRQSPVGMTNRYVCLALRSHGA